MNPFTRHRTSDAPDWDWTGRLAPGKTTIQRRLYPLDLDGRCGPADEDPEDGDDQHGGAQHQSRHPLDIRFIAVRRFFIAVCDLDLQSIKSRRKKCVHPFESRFVFCRMCIHTFLQ